MRPLSWIRSAHLCPDLDEASEQLTTHQKQLKAQVKLQVDAEDGYAEKKRQLAAVLKELSKLEAQIKAQEVTLNQERPKHIKLQEEARHVANRLTTAEKELGPLAQTHEAHAAEIKQLEAELRAVEKAFEKFEEAHASQADITLQQDMVPLLPRSSERLTVAADGKVPHAQGAGEHQDVGAAPGARQDQPQPQRRRRGH